MMCAIYLHTYESRKMCMAWNNNFYNFSSQEKLESMLETYINQDEI